jgi:hypothetical protein
MTMTPRDDDAEEDDRTDPAGPPLENGDAGRQVAHVTGMTPESAATFASFHSGRYAAFRRAA